MPIVLVIWILLTLAVLVALGFVARALCDNPRNQPDYGLLTFALRIYLKTVHRVHVVGIENDPPLDGKPTIFVCNHTAGIDPMLVHIPSKHDIRWMMAKDMRAPVLESFWNWLRIIDVDRIAGDANSARITLRHLANADAIGIFPEGALERPPQQLIPFMPGVGLLIKKSKARVVPVFIDGTPQIDPAFASLWHPSRSRVEYFPAINYADSGMSIKEITADLFARFEAITDWPVNENPKELLKD